MNEAIIETYKEECKQFSIEKFYKDNVDKKGLIFISPVQRINLNVPRYMNHTNILKEIYYMLYNEKNYYNYKDLWFNVVPNRNDIVISLTDIGVIEIVMPNRLNTWQMEEFLKVRRSLENINKNFMYVFISSNEEEKIETMNECTKRLIDRIDDNIKTSEKEIFNSKVKSL